MIYPVYRPTRFALGVIILLSAYLGFLYWIALVFH